MKILIDEMYDGLDEKLRKTGFVNVQSVKKLINDGKKLQSDFSVLNYAQENKMVLVTADVENKKGCDENGIPCIAIGKDSVFDYVVNQLNEYHQYFSRI